MNSCQKGKRGEREWAEFMRDHYGLAARRGAQFCGSPDSPDVVGGWPGTHCEVKRVEKLNIYAAIEQAMADCGDAIPYVAHRANGRIWLVTHRASDWLALADIVFGQTPLKLVDPA